MPVPGRSCAGARNICRWIVCGVVEAGDSLSIVEGRAANKVAARFGLDELHTSRFQRITGKKSKGGWPTRNPMLGRGQDVACPSRAEMRIVSRHRRRRLRALNFTVGWGTWFSNRRVGLRWRAVPTSDAQCLPRDWRSVTVASPHQPAQHDLISVARKGLRGQLIELRHQPSSLPNAVGRRETQGDHQNPGSAPVGHPTRKCERGV